MCSGLNELFRGVTLKKSIAFLLLMVSFASAADLKVKVSMHGDSPSSADNKVASFLNKGFTDQVVFVSGASQRIEYTGFAGGLSAHIFDQPFAGNLLGSFTAAPLHMAVITHCDTGVVDELDLDAHEYREFKMPRYPQEKDYLKLVDRAHKALKNDFSADTQDTGETRVFFGQTARHLITTVRQTRHGFHNTGSQFKTPVEEKVVVVIDGWYLDQPQPGCAPEFLRRHLALAITNQGTSYSWGSGSTADTYVNAPGARDVLDEPELPGWSNFWAYSPGLLLELADQFPFGFRELTKVEESHELRSTRLMYTGYLPPGLAVEQKITLSVVLPATRAFPEEKHQAGPPPSAVTELSDAPLNAALFQVPPGFKKVKVLYQHDSGHWKKTAAH
jgi:hypothetical protein